jgi:EAL domain-containing protein (putative c-di-GMP-specific phosphodiesterase class I)
LSESRRPPPNVNVPSPAAPNVNVPSPAAPNVNVPPPPAVRTRMTPPTPSAETLEQFARGTENERSAASELSTLEDKLERCLSTITMHFQPIVHAKTRSRFGYEALLRTADKALPHPGAILDAAERLERVPALGRAIRAHVARVVGESPAERGVVFLNLHLLDLLDKQLTSAFAPLTKVSHRIILEITERTSLDGQSDIRYRVSELRELGFKIAIDDLGGGHARMGTFTPLDTDFVKLDMSLVRDIDKQPLKQRLVRSMTELCRDNGTGVIGEGVETEAEANTLVDLGCDYLQGYLLARPALPFCDPL